jgi:hypothetical protein
MIGKMKIIILAVLISLTFTIRISSKAAEIKDSADEASRTVAGSQWIYLYDYSYTPALSYSPVYYGAVSRSYYYYPYTSYYYTPRSYFWVYRKDGEEAAPAEKKTDAPTESKRVEKKDDEKEKKVQVKVEELMNNLKKLKKDLWKDENFDTAQLRKDNKAYDPAWLLTQLNIATVLQIEDLLKENKIDLKSGK